MGAALVVLPASAVAATSFFPPEEHHAVGQDGSPIGKGAVEVADLDGDGLGDVITVGDGKAVVWTNQGDGGFAPTEYSTGGWAGVQGVLADLDGDSVRDLVVNDIGKNALLLLEGVAGGGFEPGIVIVSDNDMTGPMIGQFGGDAMPDIAVLDYIAEEVAIYLQAPDGTFERHSEIPTGDQPRGVEAGDLNGDDRLDLAVASAADDEVSVALQLPAGGFAAPSSTSVGNDPVAIELTDLDGDLALDAVISERGDESILVLSGTGDGGFAGRSSYPAGPYVYTVLSHDFDGDGDRDLVAPGASSGDTPLFLQGAGGAFESVAAGRLGGGSFAAAAGDLDADGELDLVMSGLDRFRIAYGDVLAMQPYDLPFGEVEAGLSASETLSIRNTGSSQAALGEVALDESGGHFSIVHDSCGDTTLEVREVCSVTVQFDAPEMEMSDWFEAFVDVEGDAATGPRFARLSAFALQPPVWMDGFLLPSTSHVAFGLTPRGSVSPTRIVSFGNGGDAEVMVTGATASEGFKVVSDGCRDVLLPPYENCDVGVAFTPGSTTAASATGTLSVTSSSPQASALVGLSGHITPSPRPPHLLRRVPGPRSTNLPSLSRGAIGAALDRLAKSVPGLVRGGPRRRLRLPAFSVGTAGRVSVALYVRSRDKRIRIASAVAPVRAGQTRRLVFSLNGVGRARLRQPRPTRIVTKVAFRSVGVAPIAVERVRSFEVAPRSRRSGQ